MSEIKDSRCRRYDEDTISLCLAIYASSSSYDIFRSWPGSPKTRQTYKNQIKQKPGILKDNLKWMQTEAKKRNLEGSEVNGGLLIDKMSIQDDLQHSYIPLAVLF